MEADQIRKVIPARVNDRESWSQDIFDIMQELSIPKTKQNVCSIVAVVDQESNFVADPTVPGLGAKAVEEINSRLKKSSKQNLAKKLVAQSLVILKMCSKTNLHQKITI